MELNWLDVVLLAILLLLNIISFVTLLVQKENKEQRKSTTMSIYNTPGRPVNYTPLRSPSPDVQLLEGGRLIYRGRDYHRLRWDEIIVKQVGNSLFSFSPDGSEQEYAKPCGSFVLGGFGYVNSSTFCVLPEGHCGKNHIDMQGNKKKMEGEVYIVGETQDLKRAARETDQSISDRQRKAVADDRDERARRLGIGSPPALEAEAAPKKTAAKKTTKTAAKKAAKKASSK